MIEVTNIRTLGQQYSISGTSITDDIELPFRIVRIIHEEEILDVVGKYNPKIHNTYDTYLTAAKMFLTGFYENLEKIAWYIPYETGEVDLNEIAYLALDEDAEIIIVQSLDIEKVII